MVSGGGLQREEVKRCKITTEKKGWGKVVDLIQNCQDQSADLIGLFGAVGGLKGVDETLWHQQQEARHVVQRLAAVNLWLRDDRPRLGRTVGREVQIDVLVDQ